MSILIIVSTISIFCLIVVGQLVSWLHWLIILVTVVCFFIFHFDDGTS